MLFGYAPREAETIDPQHRFFLECAWEALEDAGYDPDRYPGLIGVFGGTATPVADHANIRSRPDLLTSGLAAWQASVGNTNDSLATRVCVQTESARAESVRADLLLHVGGGDARGLPGLLTGECDMALAGGVNISVPNRSGYLYRGRRHHLARRSLPHLRCARRRGRSSVTAWASWC